MLSTLIVGFDRALRTLSGIATSSRAIPGHDLPESSMSDHERRVSAGLMRVNHTGEVCAQALYKGQALVARNAATAEYLDTAAAEETDHLAWCGARLGELGARPSVFNPLWYAGSYAIGVAAALAGDRPSLGFVVETERQVEAHLGEHIGRLPADDARSRAILVQMQADEARHADNAHARGGARLPAPVRALMRRASGVMKGVAFRI
jgi:ubiquinone biosynthesis monooxygenase Coq7